MRWNKDITPMGWLIVGVILAVSGIGHMVNREIHGKVRMAGKPPLEEGWPVFFTGLGELAVGILLILWYVKTRRS